MSTEQLDEVDSQLTAIENGAAPTHTLVGVVRGLLNLVRALGAPAGTSTPFERVLMSVDGELPRTIAEVFPAAPGSVDDAAIAEQQAATIAATSDPDPLAFARNSAPPVDPSQYVPKIRELIGRLRARDWLGFFRRDNTAADPLTDLANVVAQQLEDLVGVEPAS